VPAADTFVPLATWLAGPAPQPPAPEPAPEPAAVEAVPPASAPPGEPCAAATAAALRDVRLFRARLADALQVATATLVRELAYAVVGRELRIAPADVAALAARLLAEHPAAVPVEIRHAPGERVELGVPAVADPQLAPGDLVIAFTGGEIDARLGVRLAVALEAWA
jgi:flagellar biosynthesis/type III secretory pathway protein FliH